MLAKLKMLGGCPLVVFSCHEVTVAGQPEVAAYRSLWVGAFVRAELKGEKWYLGGKLEMCSLTT